MGSESGRASLLLHAAPLASSAGFPLSVFPSGRRRPPQRGEERVVVRRRRRQEHSDERTRDRSRVITEQRKRAKEEGKHGRWWR